MAIAIMTILIAIGCAGAGFGFGILWERSKWNDLIREGKLPRPGWPHH